MSECPPPGAVQDAAGQRPADLTSERIEAALAEFREWLIETAAPRELSPAPPQERPLDLHALLSQLTALRHEVHLQTKALRSQQELTAETLRQYGQALETLEGNRMAGDKGTNALEDEILRPFLKHLVDARDALALARTQVERVGDMLQPALRQLAVEPETEGPSGPDQTVNSAAGPPPRPRTFLQRLLGGADAGPSAEPSATVRLQQQALRERDQRLQQAAEAGTRVQLAFDSIRTGYRMSLQRLERALDACGLEPIRCLGEPFDPELMEVVEVAADTGRPANEVVEEVRPGYLWHGRVFRYAQVRVAKP